jgi:hypothetical protein
VSQRSPVNFWFLLAATLSVDAVASYWFFDENGGDASLTLYISLAFAQLSLICAWVVLFRERMGIGWIVPFVVGSIFALGIYVAQAPKVHNATRGEIDFDWEGAVFLIGIMFTHVAVMLPVLWLLKPTRLCARFSNAAGKHRWQFATGDLLLVMTCLAIVSVMLRRSDTSTGDVVSVVTVAAANTALFVAVLVATQATWPPPLRLAASLAAALGVAEFCHRTQLAFADELNSFVFNLIQAVVIWLWLELMGPYHQVDDADSDKPVPVPVVP